MALNAKKVKGTNTRKEIPVMDAGTYPARLVQLIDLGVQPQDPYNGQEKPPVHMIYTTYEFLDEFMLGDSGKPDESKPRWLSEKLPFYNLEQEKAKSTVRYKALDPNIDHDGDWTELLGSPCMVTVVEQTTKSGPNAGRVYNKIGGTTAMRAKDVAKAPSLVNSPKMFSLDDPDITILQSLPEWLQDLVKGNLEYKGSKLEKALQGPTKGSQTKAVEQTEEVGEGEDDVNW